MQARAAELESECERRQASYMRREEALRLELEGLQDKLRLLQARTAEARGPAASMCGCGCMAHAWPGMHAVLRGMAAQHAGA